MAIENGLRALMEPVEIPREHVPCKLCGNRETGFILHIRQQGRRAIPVDGVLPTVAEAEKIVCHQACPLALRAWKAVHCGG